MRGYCVDYGDNSDLRQNISKNIAVLLGQLLNSIGFCEHFRQASCAET